MDNTTFLAILGYLIGAGIGLLLLFVVIRAAVLSALRAHTTSSTTGVSIVSSNPLPVIMQDAPRE